jgi:hypothetical protein
MGALNDSCPISGEGYPPHIAENLMTLFAPPGFSPVPFENSVLYHWIATGAARIPDIGPPKTHANSVRLPVFDGDLYIAQES